MEESKQPAESQHPAEEKQRDTSIEHSFAPAPESGKEENYSATSANETENSKDKPQPLKVPIHSRIWSFIVEPRHSNALVAIFTVIITITGIFYTVFAGLQWGVTKDALVSVQRAFVTFAGINLDYIPQALGESKIQWIFAASVENSGATPAIDKIQSFGSSNELASEPSEAQFVGDPKSRIIGGEIGPRARATFGRAIKDSKFILGDFNPVDVGTPQFMKFFEARHVFFWGWVGYRDVFASPHLTEFCQELSGVGLTVQLRPVLNFNECHAHNCTDEHCPDYQSLAKGIPR